MSISFPPPPPIWSPQGLTVNPTGNATTTLSTLSVQEATVSDMEREYLVNFGLTSNLGSGVGSPGGDKIALYTGIEGEADSGDIWAFNPLVLLDSGFTSNAYAVEVDIQNNSQNYDTGFSYPGLWGVNISTNSNNSYRANGAVLISAANGSIFHYGLAATNLSVLTAFLYDNTDSATSYEISGSHTYGIDMRNATLTTAIGIPNEVPFTAVNSSGSTVELFRMDNTALKLGAGVPVVYLSGSTSLNLQQTSGTGLYLGGFSGSYGIDFNGSTSTPIRLANNVAMVARNAGGTADLTLLELNSGNNLVLGAGAGLTILTSSGGVQVGSPTGSAAGSGTVDVQTGYYVNGTAIADASGDLFSNTASFMLRSKTTITGGSTSNTPTLTVGPITGNPSKWLPYDDNGTTRYIPAW